MTDMGHIVNSHTVRFERILPAPIDQVWAAFTTPSGLASWLFCDATVDLRERGRVDFKFNTPDPENNHVHNVRGTISEYLPPHRIAYSWFEISSDVSSNVTFEFESRGDETLLVLTHSNLSPAFMPKVGAGWHSHIDALIAIFKGEKPAEFLPEYNRLFNVYSTAIAASLILTASVSPAVASPTDAAHKALAQQRQQLLNRYDRIWKDADDIKYKIDTLRKSSSEDLIGAQDDLERELDYKYDDLRKVEQDIKDLDKARI